MSDVVVVIVLILGVAGVVAATITDRARKNEGRR